MRRAKIVSTGMYVPEKVLTNFDLEKMVDTSDEWIRTRTGIVERHIAAEDETSADLAEKAAREALEKASVSPEELDLIIVATITPDYYFPATACLVQARLGAKNAGCFDVEAACSGFVYSLSMGASYIMAGWANKILVVAADVLSKMTDWEDRNTCVLLADGAGAALLEATDEDKGVLSSYLGGWGGQPELLYVPAGGFKKPPYKVDNPKDFFLKMNGREVYKWAVTKMEESARIALKRAGIPIEQVSLVIPHQANIRIIQTVAERLGVPWEKMFVTIHKYGNTSGATVPIALHEAIEEGRIKEGDIVVLTAMGGGFTWGASVIKF